MKSYDPRRESRDAICFKIDRTKVKAGPERQVLSSFTHLKSNTWIPQDRGGSGPTGQRRTRIPQDRGGHGSHGREGDLIPEAREGGRS